MTKSQLIDHGGRRRQHDRRLFPNIRQFRSQKMSLDERACAAFGVSKGKYWWKLKAVKPIQALRCYVRSRRQWGIRGGFCQRRQRADSPSYRPGYCSVLWRSERRQCKRLMAGTSGPDMLELWQWIIHLVNSLNRQGIQRTHNQITVC